MSTDSATLDLLAQFETLEIPPNIDPKLLALWQERELKALEDKQPVKKPHTKYGRKLSRIFAAYIGISVMCLAIILGFAQRREAMDILNNACLVFLSYTIIGYFVGCVAEYCISDSVETLLREIIRRSDKAVIDHSEETPVTDAE